VHAHVRFNRAPDNLRVDGRGRRIDVHVCDGRWIRKVTAVFSNQVIPIGNNAAAVKYLDPEHSLERGCAHEWKNKKRFQ
jgi:hypothetical protein